MSMMRPSFLAAALTASLLASACAADPSGTGEAASASSATAPAASARATLTDGAGVAKGEVVVRQQGQDLAVELTATGLTPGLHGAHIHMTGQCVTPGFASAGGHWNPTAMQHGLENPYGAHKGDLPNLDIGSDGSGKLSFIVSGAAVEGNADGLLDADGAAFVIHAGPDDMKSDPAGNSGGRIACGVFTKG